MAKTTVRNITISINGKEVENSLKGVGREIGKLKAALRKETFGSDNFKKLERQLDATKAKYREMNNELRKNDASFKKNSASVLSTIGSFAGFAGVFTLVQSGIQKFTEFTNQSIELAREAKGVEFAFARLGKEGEIAFNKVKEATRGMLSDLDIQKSLVEFDNFNLSIEDSADLFEFLSVRVAQTGKSMDYLKDSLVEGLSKESKLRIDNLGISAEELNKQLEKTPDFVKAVATIAKREVAEAGNILDEAANSAAQFDVKMENLQVRFGKLINQSGVGTFFRDIGSSMLEAITPAEDLTTQFEQQAANVVNLQKTLPPLIKEYEDLKGKSELSSEEQERLKEVIGQIADITPSAITAFDEYGNAMDISAEAARGFIETQKALLKFRNQDALAEQKEALAEYRQEIEQLTRALNNRNEAGNIVKSVSTGDVKDAMRLQKELSDREIAELQNKLNRAKQLEVGAMESIDQLSGDYLDKYIKREEAKTQRTLEEARKRADALMIPYSDESTAAQINALIKAKEKENEALAKQREKDAEAAAKQAEQDRQRKIEEFAKGELAIDQLLKDFREQREINRYSGMEKELAAIDYKYEKELERYAEHEDRLQEIMAQREQEKADLKLQYTQDYLTRAYELEEENRLLKEEEEFERELEKLDSETEKEEMRLAHAEELALLELERLKEQELAKVEAVEGAEELKQQIREKYALLAGKVSREFNEQEKKLRQDQVKWTDMTEQEKLSAITGALASAADAFNEGSEAWKAIKISETMISTFQGAQATFTGMTQAIPGPVGLALGIAGAALATVAGLKRVQQISNTKLEKIKKPKTRGHFEGGHTGDDAIGFDGDGPITHYVHEKEYVVPQIMAQNPKYANTIGWLENERQKIYGRGYATGGPVGETSMPTIPEDTTSTALLQSLQLLNERLATPIQAQMLYGYEDEEKRQRIQNDLKNSNSNGTLS